MEDANAEDKIAVYQIIIGYLLAMLLYFLVLSTSDIVSLNPPYTLNSVTQMVAGVGSLVLSFALVWHYRKQTKVQKEQTKIQENQEQIMEMQYRPRVSPGITLENNVPKLVIKNIGLGTAMQVDVDWEIAGEERSWSTPFLSSGEEVSFPLLKKRDQQNKLYTCNIVDVKNMVSESEELVVNITYQNVRHEGRKSRYTRPILERLERLEKSASGSYVI